MIERIQWRWVGALVLTMMLPAGTVLGQQAGRKFGVRPSERHGISYRRPPPQDFQRHRETIRTVQNTDVESSRLAAMGVEDPAGERTPLDADRLSKRLPASVGNLPRLREESPRDEVVLPVIGHYANAERTQSIKITLYDIDGGVPGMSESDIERVRNMTLNQETSEGHIRTRTVGGYKALERLDRPTQTGEITLIAGERVAVHVLGTGVSISAVEAAVTSLNLPALAAINR